MYIILYLIPWLILCLGFEAETNRRIASTYIRTWQHGLRKIVKLYHLIILLIKYERFNQVLLISFIKMELAEENLIRVHAQQLT